eukprot:TRINITY_DN3056_c0_g1_i3.p1 TRINITY_DN3056_c0_g1~~TRINITY_DN3056_c0_g1_i3.p1  ORF type:complete len:682 (-),score=205.83 TRINITY_DN3056_c0_g1_i3:45-1799(-)
MSFDAPLGSAAAAATGGDGTVITLTDTTFKEEIAKGGVVLVKFFAPWCSHCAKAAAPFAQAAAKVPAATFADLDATVHKATAAAFQVTAYPTYKLFRDGRLLSSFSGAPSVPTYTALVERALRGDGVAIIPPGGVSAWLAAADPAVEASFLGVGLAADGEYARVAFDVSGTGAGRGRFGITASVDDAKAAAAAWLSSDADAPPPPTVVAGIVLAFQGGGDAPTALDGTSPTHRRRRRRVRVYDGGANGVGGWAKAAALGEFGEVTAASAGAYLHSGFPLAILLVNGSTPDAAAVDTFAAVAGAMDGTQRVVLAWGAADSPTVAPFRAYLGLGDAPLPALAIYAFANDATYLYAGALEAAPIVEWLATYASGALAPTVMSEPAPTASPPPGRSSRSLAPPGSRPSTRPAKTCLSCSGPPGAPTPNGPGRCSKRPLAALVGVPSLTIAAMDASLNDAPVAYRTKNFPTFHFFKGGERRGLPYKTRRATADFVDFMREHAATPFEVDLAAAAADAKAEAKRRAGGAGSGPRRVATSRLRQRRRKRRRRPLWRARRSYEGRAAPRLRGSPYFPLLHASDTFFKFILQS